MMSVRSRWARLRAAEGSAGALLLIATVVAIAWASSPWAHAYEALRTTTVGPSSLGLHLSLGAWASDGLLAIFFLVVGLELKHELVRGALRDPRRAVVPAVAAVGGMLAPALVYVVVNLAHHGGDLTGWAVPTATDIAFAVSVLAVAGRRLPRAARTFLLTLAVVDDLLAIVVIAVVYTDGIRPWPLLGALGVVGLFAVVVRRRRAWFVLVPLGLVAWALVHASGVHATIAGVLLGLVVPASRGVGGRGWDAQEIAHRWGPVSNSVAVPLFALLAAGVAVDAGALRGAVGDPVAVGVALGLVVGKPAGILGAAWLVTRTTSARFDPSLRWGDLAAVGALGGIGFTVALLVGELAFGAGSAHDDHVRLAVLGASVVAALLGAALAARAGGSRARPRA